MKIVGINQKGRECTNILLLIGAQIFLAALGCALFDFNRDFHYVATDYGAAASQQTMQPRQTQSRPRGPAFYTPSIRCEGGSVLSVVYKRGEDPI